MTPPKRTQGHFTNYNISELEGFFPFSLYYVFTGRDDRYSHEFVSDDDEEEGVDANNDTLQQSFANFSHVAPRFSQMIEEMQSMSEDNDPNHQQLRNKTVNILSEEGPKHEHRDSGISGECTGQNMLCSIDSSLNDNHNSILNDISTVICCGCV